MTTVLFLIVLLVLTGLPWPSFWVFFLPIWPLLIVPHLHQRFAGKTLVLLALATGMVFDWLQQYPLGTYSLSLLTALLVMERFRKRIAIYTEIQTSLMMLVIAFWHIFLTLFYAPPQSFWILFTPFATAGSFMLIKIASYFRFR